MASGFSYHCQLPLPKDLIEHVNEKLCAHPRHCMELGKGEGFKINSIPQTRRLSWGQRGCVDRHRNLQGVICQAN